MKALVIEDDYLYRRFSLLLEEVNISGIILYDSFFDYSNNPEEDIDEVIYYNVDYSVVEYLNANNIQNRELYIGIDNSGKSHGGIDLKSGFYEVLREITEGGRDKNSIDKSIGKRPDIVFSSIKDVDFHISLYRFSNEDHKENYIYNQNNISGEEGRQLILDLDNEHNERFREYFTGSGIFFMRALRGKALDFNKLLLSNSKTIMYLRLFLGGEEGDYLRRDLLFSILEKSKKFGVRKVIFVVTSAQAGIYPLLGSLLGEYRSMEIKEDIYGEAI